MLCGKSCAFPRYNYYRQSQNGGTKSRSHSRPFRLASSSFSFYPPLSCLPQGGADTADPVPGRVQSDVSHPPLIHSTLLLVATPHFRFCALRTQLGCHPAAAAAALPALAHQAPSSLFRQRPPASKSPYRAGAEAKACDLGHHREQFRVNGRSVWRDNNMWL